MQHFAAIRNWVQSAIASSLHFTTFYVKFPVQGLNTMIQKLLDPKGLVTRWPKKPEESAAVLEYFASKYETDKRYTEMEVNAILKQWHTFNDHPMLRRELVNSAILDRSVDGREYWKK